jgi:alpha-galactosidase
MFWIDDRLRGHNLWRKLLLDHYSPRPGGELVQVPLGTATEWHNEEQSIALINWHADNGLPIEYFWMDIGWQREPKEDEAREYLIGNVPNEKMFPHGLGAVSDAAHKHGLKYLLWFGGNPLYPSLERVQTHRPELLSEEYPGVDNGNPMINRYMIDFYSNAITEWGIDIFRQDRRSTPPPDASGDRLGINWARTAEGFYEFWDALLERFPNLIIDCCGGGGNNIDLETTRRSIFLWRSDYQTTGIHEPENVFDPIGIQTQTHGVSLWVPLTGGAVHELSSYAFRSGYSPGLQLSIETLIERFFTDPPEPPSEDEFDVDLLRTLINEYLSVRHCFYGDYYPLTRFNLDQDAWIAWQFDRPDLAEGIVQAFRRPESAILTCRYHLQGLEPHATYELTNFDLPETIRMSGTELMDEGLVITIPDQPGAIVIRYNKAL